MIAAIVKMGSKQRNIAPNKIILLILRSAGISALRKNLRKNSTLAAYKMKAQ
jgi:hypothetical protein